MSTVTPTTPTVGIPDPPYAITSDQFARMVEQGVFPADSRVFLWAGGLFEMRAKSKAHAAVQNALISAIGRRLPPGLFLGAENPVRLDETHLPLPDLIVARGTPLDFFSDRFPDGRDVLLVVEVAVTSLPADLGSRLSRYAACLPMADYLVVDVPGRRLILHGGPSPDGEFAERIVIGPGESLGIDLDGRPIEPIRFDEVMP